jgi:putative phosphoesterase
VKRILLLSDTHGHLDEAMLRFVDQADEVWHAGDIGPLMVTDALAERKPLRAVYGNIDDHQARRQFPLDLLFEIHGLKVYITHIGGYPGRYSVHARGVIEREQPGLFICGHSHILKVMPDRTHNLLHMNPGAAGIHGFHAVRTMLRFVVHTGKVEQLEVIELGKRGVIRN